MNSAPQAPRPPDEPELTLRHALISGFIAVHLFAIACMSIPIDTSIVRAVRARVQPYMRAIGLAQAWPMFAPDAPTFNGHVEAQITYRSGHTQVWVIPFPSAYPLRDRFFVERYRAWGEYVWADPSPALRVDAARYVALTHGDRPADRPVTVTLIRYSAPIPLPDDRGATEPLRWRHDALFTYAIQPGDLP